MSSLIPKDRGFDDEGGVLLDLQVQLTDVDNAIRQYEQRLEELKRRKSELQAKLEKGRLESRPSVHRFQVSVNGTSAKSLGERIVGETEASGDLLNAEMTVRQRSPVPRYPPKKKKRQWQSVVRRKPEIDGFGLDSDSDLDPRSKGPKKYEHAATVSKDAGIPANRKNANKDTSEFGYAYQEVVRKQEERRQLPGHECDECRKFYRSIMLPDEMLPECKHARQRELCDAASRHRYRYKRASTPPGYWDID